MTNVSTILNIQSADYLAEMVAWRKRSIARNYKRRNIDNVGARNAARANVKALCRVVRILTTN